MNNMKIKIKDPEHSKRVQEALFKLGYEWAGWNQTKKVKHIEFPALYAEGGGHQLIRYCSDDFNDLSWFNGPEETAAEYYLTAMDEFRPVYEPKEATKLEIIPMGKVIEDMVLNVRVKIDDEILESIRKVVRDELQIMLQHGLGGYGA